MGMWDLASLESQAANADYLRIEVLIALNVDVF